MGSVKWYGYWSAAVLWFLTAPVSAAEVVQHFPADKPASEMETAWRVVWGITRHAEAGEILYIKEAYFKRGPKEEEIKVLGDCRLAEVFVPYNDGHRIYDIEDGYELEAMGKDNLGPACIGLPKLFDRDGKATDKGLVAVELHDDHLRWKNRHGQARRGQEMHIWATLDASNYRYIMLYIFRDDGQVGFRLGSTAHNLREQQDDTASHLHTGCWRLNVELGSAAKTDIYQVRYVSKPGSEKAATVVEKFNGGKEGGLAWKAEEFTRLRIQSQILKNKHQPANYIGYELVSTRQGTPRLYGEGEEFTHRDFWVTRANFQKEELIYKNVPNYVNDEQPLDGPLVIWHHASVWHSPRDEDFGPDGYQPGQGSALTAWCGFDLRPRNFFAGTPLYP